MALNDTDSLRHIETPLRDEIAFDFIKILAKVDHDLIQDAEHDENYPPLYRWLATLIHAAILVIGLLGNGAVIFGGFRHRRLHSCSIYPYLLSASSAMMLTLSTVVPDAIVGHHVGLSWISGQWGCSLMVFFRFLGVHAASLSVLTGVTRLFCLSRALDCVPSLSSGRSVRILIVFIWLFCLLYSAPWLALTVIAPRLDRPNGDEEICAFRISNRAYTVFFLLDSVLHYFLPLMTSLLLLIVVRLKIDQLDTVCTFGALIDDRQDDHIDYKTTPNLTEATQLQGHELEQSRFSVSVGRRFDLKAVYRVLASVQFALFVLAAPSVLLLIHNCLAEVPWLDPYFLFFSKTLLFIFYAGYPFILLLSPDYRKSILPCSRSETIFSKGTPV